MMRPMKRLLVATLALLACHPAAPEERYGFVARLGNDTVAVESVTRSGSLVTSDAVDRFPRVRRRHTKVELAADGRIEHLEMQIWTPSEPAAQRERRVVVDVTHDSVRITKTDDSATVVRAFATQGGEAMAHVPQMYSLYELYFAAALRRAAETRKQPGDTVQMRQFYIDREFDRFPLHHGVVRLLPDHRAEISHDWLSGIGEARLDSSFRLLGYSGARTTYQVEVSRLTTPPDVQSIGERFERDEARGGGARQLSVRDTLRARIGAATFLIDYGRPLARGRVLLGKVIPWDRVWRTGANAATQFTTSAAITLGGLEVPAGSYTLWTIPRVNGVELVVNRQTGQWGTGYGAEHDLGRVSMRSDSAATPTEQFTIAIEPAGNTRGTLLMAWGSFRWSVPIEVH